MIDTGYGIYHDSVMAMLSRYGLWDMRKLSRIIVTHADADHCGAAGFFAVPVYMHEGTLDIIRTNNRAYGSRSDHSDLDAFYTKMINLFSKFNTPKDIRCFGARQRDKTGDLPGDREIQDRGPGTRESSMALAVTPTGRSSCIQRIMGSSLRPTVSSTSGA